MSDKPYYDHLEFNGQKKEFRDNLAQNRINDIVDYKTYNLTMQGSEWITLAKVGNVLKNSSALFTITCYGVKDNERSILTTSKFSLSCGLSDTKELITSVTPLSQVPEIQQGGDASGGSSTEGGSTQEVSEASVEPTSDGEPSSDAGGSGESGSGNSAIYGLNNIAFEKYDDNTIYVMGLLSFPATDKYDSLDVEMRLDDNLNFEYLENLDVIYKQEDDTLQEGTQIYVKGDYVNYYMRDALILIQQYINSVGTYGSGNYASITFKREDGNLGNNTLMYKTDFPTNIEYYICGITGVITEYVGLVKDYEKFRNQDAISIPIQLGVEFNLFNILKEYIDNEVTDDLGKGYKVKLHKYSYLEPDYVVVNYNGLDENESVHAFALREVGKDGKMSIMNNNGPFLLFDKDTPNYIITGVDESGTDLELEGTIYIKLKMNPNNVYVDFIFNSRNQFPNGQNLEITQVNVLPLRYMGGTKVENYSQSYELYNPYKKINTLEKKVISNNLSILEIGDAMNYYRNENDEKVNTNIQDIEIALNNIVLLNSCNFVEIPDRYIQNNFYKDGHANIKYLEFINTKKIGKFAFYVGIIDVEKIKFGDKLEKIGEQAFAWTKTLKEIDLGNNIENCYYCFAHCNNLDNVVIPKSLAIFTGAFVGCKGLTNVTIKTWTISNASFEDCTSLKKVVWNYVNDDEHKVASHSISNEAFKGATLLDTFIINMQDIANNEVVRISNVNAFEGTSLSQGNGYVYVNDDSVENYKADSKWRQVLPNYNTQIRPLSEYVEE